jgi:peptidoglycan/LPS O-acetylase OafA/YrhL
MRKLWLYNVLYLMNFKIAFDHSWTGPFHFWSLAVEEQFYLLWFLIIAMVPARYLLKVILLIILLAHLWRVMIVSIGVSIFWDYLLPGVMDSLAMGALIAYATRKAPQSRWWLLFLRFRMPLLLISFLLLVLTYKRSYGSAFSSIFLRSFWTLCSACLVSFGIEQRKDWRFDWLGNKILRHFGKISYGIYVFHLFVPGIFHLPGLQRLHMESKPIFIQLIVFSLIAWWIAEISWHFLEKPILNLKDKAPFWVHS